MCKFSSLALLGALPLISSAALRETANNVKPRASAGPGSVLQPSYVWIRAVETPNYHKYLQTVPAYAPGNATLGDAASAGQFNIVNGQLVELTDANKGTLLYANVGQKANASSMVLPVVFSAQKGTHGTFAFQGDAVTWSTPEITRPNVAAWLVCGGQQLFVNLGSYGYMTPAGCSDATIHSYNNQHADV